MRVLLIHQNFPGQFRQLGPALVEAGHGVIGLGARQEPWAETGVPYRSCGGQPDQEMRQTNPEMRMTAQLAQGRRVSRQLKALREEAWIPDVVVAHPFWGEVLFLDDVFPGVPLVALLELDFSGLELERFDAEIAGANQQDFGANLGLRQWADLMAMRRMQAGLTATHFQRSSFPAWLQARIAVIHEGVDLESCRPDPLASFILPDGQWIRRGDAVVSFGSRSLEPLRGFRTASSSPGQSGGEGGDCGPGRQLLWSGGTPGEQLEAVVFERTRRSGRLESDLFHRSSSLCSIAADLPDQPGPCLSHLSLCVELELAGGDGLWSPRGGICHGASAGGCISRRKWLAGAFF